MKLKLDPETQAQMELAKGGSVMGKPANSTGSELLDTILGIGSIDPTSAFSGPMGIGGVMSEALRKHQLSAAPKWIEELMAHPSFNKFRQKIQSEVERALGPLFKVYRGIGPQDLKVFQETGMLEPRPSSFSVDPQVAKGFAFSNKLAPQIDQYGKMIHPGWQPKMLEALATPESVIARPTWNPESNVFGREKELLLDPKTLFNYVLQELDPNVVPKSVYPVIKPANPAPGWWC